MFLAQKCFSGFFDTTGNFQSLTLFLDKYSSTFSSSNEDSSSVSSVTTLTESEVENKTEATKENPESSSQPQSPDPDSSNSKNKVLVQSDQGTTFAWDYLK